MTAMNMDVNLEFKAGGHRYIKTRRHDLYGDILSEPHHSEQRIV